MASRFRGKFVSFSHVEKRLQAFAQLRRHDVNEAADCHKEEQACAESKEVLSDFDHSPSPTTSSSASEEQNDHEPGIRLSSAAMTRQDTDVPEQFPTANLHDVLHRRVRAQDSDLEVENTSDTTDLLAEALSGDSDAEPAAENNRITKNSDGPSVLSGRRLVELRLVSERLENGCCTCSFPLSLIHCTKEERFGLASGLHIRCNAKQCGAINTVQTSKTHTASSGSVATN